MTLVTREATQQVAEQLADREHTKHVRHLSPVLVEAPFDEPVSPVGYAEVKAAAGHGMGALVAQRVLQAADFETQQEVREDAASGGRSYMTANALPFTE